MPYKYSCVSFGWEIHEDVMYQEKYVKICTNAHVGKYCLPPLSQPDTKH